MNLTKEKLAELLTQAELAHAEYEKQTGESDTNWPAWYAEFIIKKLEENEN